MYGIKGKKRVIGGREYMVAGSTIERDSRFQVIRKSYTTNRGRVVVEGGVVTHPDGTTTSE